MQDQDPASLFFASRDEYAPLLIDPSLFESVGEGVAPNIYTIPDRMPPSPSTGQLQQQKACAEKSRPLDQVGASSKSVHHDQDGVRERLVGRKRKDMGTLDAWDTVWGQDLDHNVQRIDRRSIFDSFLDAHCNHTADQDSYLSPLTSIPPLQTSPVATRLGDNMTMGPRTDECPKKSTHSVFGPLSHPVRPESPLEPESSNVKPTADLVFELPPLSKRPRNILDEYCDRRNSGVWASASSVETGNSTGSTKTYKIPPRPKKNETRMIQVNTWHAAGTPSQRDTTTGQDNESAAYPDKVQLTWEMSIAAGPLAQPGIPIASPYVTEAGVGVFEAAYQRHQDYAFKFRSNPAIVPCATLVDSIFLLLSGTPSSVFTYNPDSMKFEMGNENIRIEGCSTQGVFNLLQDMMDAGTHIRRLVNVSETCIHHPEGMGLIRIAFGRSLSSYLTFLQGTIVVLQETSRKKQMQVLELHHKTRGVTLMLERLANLCQCHVAHDMMDTSVARLGFYLPSGPDLLSMICDEIQAEPGSADPLWTALLLSILDQASKPYRDILSRWLGITPSAVAELTQNRASRISDAEGLSLSGISECGAVGNDYSKQQRAKESRSDLLSIFDCHLQQSLQGLDPFDEFFVQSKHGWSWDGSEPIILADPLDYDAEFRMGEKAPPEAFIDEQLAAQVIEAGKGLQILTEFEPKHPLIVHDRNRTQTCSGFEWLCAQDEIVALKRMGWIRRRTTKDAQALTRQRMRQILEKDGNANSTLRVTVQNGAFSEASQVIELDMDLSQLPGASRDPAPPLPSAGVRLDFGLDSDLQGFFSLSPSVGKMSGLSLACPNTMAFLLGPYTLGISSSRSSASPFLSTEFGASTTANQQPDDLFLTPMTRLEVMAPLAILLEQSLGYSIRMRISLINTCVMSLYFHDLNLLGHLEVMKRFLLMRDGRFMAILAEALFAEETGLLARTVCITNRLDAASTSVNAPATASPSMLLLQGSLSGARNNGRRISVGSTPSGASAWQAARPRWPPKTGELEMGLRTVLLDCFQSSSSFSLMDREAASRDDRSDGSDMEIEGSATAERAWLTAEKIKRRQVDPQELEESLAFAVKEYDDHTKISRDVNDAVLKQLFRQLRARQKALVSFTTHETTLHPQQSQLLEAWMKEMKTLHRFRFEAQQMFDGFHGYIMNVAMGSTWEVFIKRLSAVQERIEDQILSGCASEGSDDEEATILDSGRDDPEIVNAMKDQTTVQGRLLDELDNLAALHEFHEHVLDLMLLRSLLKRKQAPILKVIYGIMSCILKLSQYVDRLPEIAHGLTHLDGNMDGNGAMESLDQQQPRMAKLEAMHEKFRVSCRMLIKVLKVLDERGVGMEGTRNSSSCSTEAAEISFLQQLLLCLDISGFHD
ncbi:Gamma-tubulin complex component 6 [Gamsiella multidivaricata]|nr:Gamma-tubulin complex component 6 [Gamsiella multidivaricata]